MHTKLAEMHTNWRASHLAAAMRVHPVHPGSRLYSEDRRSSPARRRSVRHLHGTLGVCPAGGVFAAPGTVETTTQLIGSSAAMREIGKELLSASRSDAKVLITGESGVGKEVVARLIHQRSQRAQGPLVTINCAGVPDSLLESELFGHVRGSFTDAYCDKRGWLDEARGGTIFMDEVGDMSLRMQGLLLRFLENGEIQRVGSDRVDSRIDVRVIAATNRNLLAGTADKSFREDLYYRLNVIHVSVPPLRDRKEDIPPLFDHFLRVHGRQHRVEPARVPEETMALLVAYDWPGNVRELKNAAERLVIRKGVEVIAPQDLPREILGKWSGAITVDAMPPVRPIPEILLERMSVGGESFWTVVYEPFIARDLTRGDVRTIVSRGLERTKGSYKALVHSFNLQPTDYGRFLSFLRKHECHMPFLQFRALPGALPDDDQPFQQKALGSR
jgi:DNA-binding NtrC family response regulator